MRRVDTIGRGLAGGAGDRHGAVADFVDAGAGALQDGGAFAGGVGGGVGFDDGRELLAGVDADCRGVGVGGELAFAADLGGDLAESVDDGLLVGGVVLAAVDPQELVGGGVVLAARLFGDRAGCGAVQAVGGGFGEHLVVDPAAVGDDCAQLGAHLLADLVLAVRVAVAGEHGGVAVFGFDGQRGEGAVEVGVASGERVEP